MVASLAVIDSNGVPLIGRANGVPSSEFAHLGLYHALLHTSKQFNTPLKEIKTKDSRMLFQSFHDSILLVLTTSSTIVQPELLELIFHSMVMMVGLKGITEAPNADLLKKSLKASYDLLDLFLRVDQLPIATCLHGPEVLVLGNVIENEIAVDVSLRLRTAVQEFATITSASHVCLYIEGKIAAATPDWWSLHPQELTLLSLLLKSFPPATSRDIPVYLPHTNPKVPFRFMTFLFVPHVELVLLCGPEPDLNRIQNKILEKIFVPQLPLIHSSLDYAEAGIPPSISFDTGVIGFVFLNLDPRFFYSFFPDALMSKSRLHSKGTLPDPSRVRTLIHTFYANTRKSLRSSQNIPLGHRFTESYTHLQNATIYYLQRESAELCIALADFVPEFAWAGVAEETFDKLLRIPSVC